MTRCAVLLRGVNLGSRNRIAMPAFRSLLEQLGCADVATYLQSGNAVVGWTGSAAALRSAVEQALADQLDLPVPVLVRTSRELDETVARNPFPVGDPKLLHVVFLSGGPPEVDAESLLPDRLAPGPECFYVAYADGSRDSEASKLLTSRRFPLVASARNWRTVLALQEMCRQ